MEIGNKVKIVHIDQMWDKEIYYEGWGLTDGETLKDYIDNVPKFDNLEFFENGDEVTIMPSNSLVVEDSYMLTIELTDNNGNDFKCHSQTYSLDELKSFVKPFENYLLSDYKGEIKNGENDWKCNHTCNSYLS